MPKTILLIHGAWFTPSCWDSFRNRFEVQGHSVLAPPWPLEDRNIDQLRRTPHRQLGTLTIARIVDHYESLIRALPEPPILMGHSFGGLFVEMLLNRGVGAAGVAISPAPVAGVFPRPRALWATLPELLSWGGWNRALTLSFSRFCWGFAHTLSANEQRAAYEQHVVPTPGRLFYQVAFGSGNRVDFAQMDRAPLLLIGAEQDRIVPVSMVEATYEKYRSSDTITEFASFRDRTHFMISMPGWEEIADYALRWALAYARAPAKAGVEHRAPPIGERLAAAVAE